MTTGREVIQECEHKMHKTVEATKEKFTAIRAGRATVSMLDNITVEQYGSEMPLNQVSTVSAPEARLLVIDPWDKSIIPAIEKRILAANLGMNPNNDGKVIRLVMPELTSERRKEYVKLAKKEAENGKIATRNVRKEMNNALKKIEKDKDSGMSEDDLKRFEAEVQTLTDKTIKELDDLLAHKEKEIMTV